MSRYNSIYSGSQIDTAIGYTLNGFPSLSVTGNAVITGSLIVNGGITGSLFGTASYEIHYDISSSYASYSLSSSFSETASYALTASYASNAKPGIISNKILYVSANANGTNQYTTIASAIAAYTTGSTIMLAPETFDEDVVLNTNNIIIVGNDREKTIIKSLTFNSKDNFVSNVKVQNDLTFLCTETYSPRNANSFINSIAEGNIYIGTVATINTYEVNIDGCYLTGVDKEFVFNGYAGAAISWGTHWVRNTMIRDRIEGNTTIWNPVSSYHLKVYSGSLYFAYCPNVRFTTITYEGEAVIRFDHCFIFECEEMNFNYDGTALPSGTGHMVLNIEESGFYYGWNKPLHMRYKTEFNIIHSYIFTTGTVITYDSVAASRWVSVLQKVWGSTTSLTGTELKDYLHIWNSMFRFSHPGELATDIGNTWETFIDY